MPRVPHLYRLGRVEARRQGADRYPTSRRPHSVFSSHRICRAISSLYRAISARTALSCWRLSSANSASLRHSMAVTATSMARSSGVWMRLICARSACTWHLAHLYHRVDRLVKIFLRRWLRIHIDDARLRAAGKDEKRYEDQMPQRPSASLIRATRRASRTARSAASASSAATLASRGASAA